MPGGSIGGILSAVLGAAAVQLLPWAALPGSVSVRAAWCWATKPPSCTLPSIPNGKCLVAGETEERDLRAGESCAPQCSGGKVATGSTCLNCPTSSADQSKNPGCFDDLSAKTWWDPCGFGDVCMNPITIGVGEWTTLGEYNCVDSSASGIVRTGNGTQCAPLEAPEVEDVIEKLDVAAAGLLGALVGEALLGSVASLAAPAGLALILFKPGPMNWSTANVLAVLAALVGLIVLPAALPSTLQVKSTGTAAGIALLLTIAWSFFKLGINEVMGMTREAAWKIHYTFGAAAMVFGVAHGTVVLSEMGGDAFGKIWWIFGLVGLILMILSVFPAVFLPYNAFKLLHYAAYLGYVFTLLHMLEHAFALRTVAAVTLAAAHSLLLLLYYMQKILVKISSTRASVLSADVSSEPCGRHIFLNLNASQYAQKVRPGQWGHLLVPSISKVAHPFTLVPGDAQGSVKIFMKVGGQFTTALADACRGGAEAAPKMYLEGPYGIPALPSKHVTQAVFLMGGVGITPALSLVQVAAQQYGQKPYLGWYVRSSELLHRSAAFLEEHMDKERSCVVLSTRSSDAENQTAGLPLGAKHGVPEVASWIKQSAQALKADGHGAVMLFVCGPAGMVTSAKAAVAKATEVSWHVHVEEFLFLPRIMRSSSRGNYATQPQKLGMQEDSRGEVPTAMGGPAVEVGVNSSLISPSEAEAREARASEADHPLPSGNAPSGPPPSTQCFPNCLNAAPVVSNM